MYKKTIVLVIFFVSLLFSNAVKADLLTNEYVFPIKKHSSNNYFVDQNNKPFFINGSTPWSLIGQLSKEDAQTFINDAADKGVNSLIITLVESFYADNAPANYYGDYPFVNNGNPTSNFSYPNEAYFAHADWVIQKASEKGINVIIAPMYLGCCNDGYLDELINDNTVSSAQNYGNFIGNRYKNFDNIMYVWFNDLNPSSQINEKMRAMVNAVKANDSRHLHTYHFANGNSALDRWSNDFDDLDFNITYTYDAVYNKVLQDYNRRNIAPFFMFESHYENDFGGADATQVRRQAYTSVLSGSPGHHYGNDPIWHMNSKGGSSWKNHLNDEGRASLLPNIRKLFESRKWYSLIPDEDHNVVTAGVGSGQNYTAAAITSDNSTLIVYIPTKKNITVDTTKLSGETLNAYWFNPVDGNSEFIGQLTKDTDATFTPPINGDSVLVIDDASKNYAIPGTEVLPTIDPSPTSDPYNSKIDVNEDGVNNLQDVIALIKYMFGLN